jgi:hypothetical protein
MTTTTNTDRISGTVDKSNLGAAYENMMQVRTRAAVERRSV